MPELGIEIRPARQLRRTEGLRDSPRERLRLAYLVTHPIQYQAPLLKRIALDSGLELKVFFASDVSTRPFKAEEFGREIAWDTELLDGYAHEFLPALGRIDRVSTLRPLNVGLAPRLRRDRFSALWIHGYMRPHHWHAIATARRSGIRVLVRDEATLISIPRRRWKRALKTMFFAWLSRVADAFLAIGTLNRDYYLSHGIPARRIFWTPYAVDNELFQERTRVAGMRREQLRARLNLQPGRAVILFAGKLMERKRPGDLLEAWLRLTSNRRQPPYLLIVGDGELRAALEARARGHEAIRFLGFRNQAELPAYYDLCDLFVMPSEREPWGLVVNEVMNAARAVISSDQVGCAPDLVRNGHNGFIYPAGDVARLSQAISAALALPPRLREMGRHSLEIINHWNYDEDLRGLHAALAGLRL